MNRTQYQAFRKLARANGLAYALRITTFNDPLLPHALRELETTRDAMALRARYVYPGECLGAMGIKLRHIDVLGQIRTVANLP